MFRISLRAGETIATMQTANCIENARQIIAGQTIHVPASFYASTSSTIPGTNAGGTTTSGSTLSGPLVAGCSVANVRISGPAAGSSLTQIFGVTGTAYTTGELPFNFFKVELQREGDAVVSNVGQSPMPAFGPNDLLAVIDPSVFGPGTYWITVTAVDQIGNYPPPCAIRVSFP